MSGILMTPCWNLSLGTTHKIVLLSLADNASDEGFCFPHVATIMRRTSLSRPTVFRALQWLEEHGYIRRLSGAIEGKGNKYIVDPTGNAAAERDRERDFLGVARQRAPYHCDTPPYHSDTPPVSHIDSPPTTPIVEVLNCQVNSQGTSTPPLPPTKPEAFALDAKPTKRKRNSIPEVDMPEGLGIDAEEWAELLMVCRKKGKPLTRIRWNRMVKNAEAAGMKPHEVVTLCAEEGWASYKPEYNSKPQQNGGQQNGYADARAERKEMAKKILEPFFPHLYKDANTIDVRATSSQQPLQFLEHQK